MKIHSTNKTRFAPTPSGFLHMGNVLSFAITTAIAKQHKASILLRIDDLDKERVRQEYVQDIFSTLSFLQIPWQEGPMTIDEYEKHSQFTKLDLYNDALEQLVELDEVFACDCSRKNLQEKPCYCQAKNIPLTEKDICWRLKTSKQKTVHLNNLDGSTEEHALPNEQNHFIVRKKDGLPSYQLASLVDDVHFNINIIVRGQDLFNSTLAQLYLANVLGLEQFKQASFYHHPLLIKANGEKLSKSAGDTSIQYLRKQGIKPEYVFGSIAKALGFNDEIKNWQQLASLIYKTVSQAL